MRRANTHFQLMTRLEENHHSVLIVEHDPLLYAPALDPHLQEMAELADRMFCIYNEPAAARDRGKAEARMAGEQRTLEAYS